MRAISLVAICALSVPACTREQDPARVRQQHQSTLRSFQPVSYHRTGGTLNPDDRVTIAKDGAIQAEGRLLGKLTGRLTDLQIMQLATLLEGWDKLDANYPAPGPTADVPLTRITYGDKTVTASDAAPTLPEQFVRVRQRIEGLVRDLPPPSP